MNLLLAFLLFAQIAAAHTQEFSAGQLIERVVCKADQSQSYALFLPSSYTPNRKWPIIYCFDPGARGSLPVERFKAAAEKYGYIVVGSNNSRNGPGVPLDAIINTLWQDTHARLAIDGARIYTAGFSGGARVACAVGNMSNGKVAGVIACGGGFPQNILPSRSIPFVFFGAAGIDDFNLIEVKRLAKSLDEFGIPSRVAIFEGGHEWAPAEICMEAIEWMEIRAIIAGKREKDGLLIEALFNKRFEKARSQEATNSYDAYLGYEAIARDFKGLRDVAAFETKAAELRDSKEVKQHVKQEKEAELKQERRTKELYALRRIALGPDPRNTGGYDDSGAVPQPGASAQQDLSESSDNRQAAASDLKRILTDLRKKSEEKESSAERAVARRILNQFFVQSYELAAMLRHRGDHKMAAANLEIAALIRPENPRVFYNLASAYSLNKEKRKAIEALKRAVERGFKDVGEIERDKEFDALRQEAEFMRIVEELKKT
ncbi:MAG TPA: hypothetical protein VF131_07025 [Blastocatellia bacterium]|nr:hypothetical protein [Blastocatellia bacterium]